MWHELRVVLHNRENALLSQTVQTFAREEQEFSEHVVTNWVALGERIDNMPFE
jgi:sorting nexin-8